MADTDNIDGTGVARKRGPQRRGGVERITDAYEEKGKPVLLILFVLTLIIPAWFEIGPIRLSFFRVFLLIMFLPLAFRWVSGRYGGILTADVFIIAFALWTLVSAFVNYGMGSQVQFFFIQNVELIGAYLLARVYIRDVDSFIFFVKILCFTLLFLLPLALLESLTRIQPIANLVNAIPGLTADPNVNYEPRLGLYRAQVVFPHPILYGVFASTVFALAWLVPAAWGASMAKRFFWASVVFLATFFSLSSGAILALLAQIGLMTYNWMFRAIKARWVILVSVIAVFYVLIDMLSNRTPITIFISFATFSSHNAWYRIAIWDYGIAEVYRNPIFGIALKEWIRPYWMYTASVDNFWLSTAMRYGVVGLFFIAVSLFATMRGIIKMDFSNRPDLAYCQRAYLISLFSTGLSLCTVHVWSNAFVYVVFLVASGVWMYTMPASELAAPVDDPGDDAPPGRRVPKRRASPQRRGQNPPARRGVAGNRFTRK